MGIRQKRKLNSLLGIAIIFIILGLGNILFGQSRVAIYSGFLYNAEQRALESNPPENPAPERLQDDNQNRHIQRLKARLDFYKVVVIGGKSFLAFAGFMLLTYLVMLRDSGSKR